MNYRERAYYSALEQAIADAPMQSADVSGWMNYLRGKINRGEVKEEELKWTDFPARLADFAEHSGNGKLQRDTVREIAEAGAVRIRTWVNERSSRWIITTLHGEVGYPSETAAAEAFEEEESRIQYELVSIVTDQNEGHIVVYDHEDELADDDREGSVETVATFTRTPSWSIKDEYLERDDAIAFAEKEVAEFDERYPDGAPHHYIFASGSESLVIRDKDDKEIDSYYANTDLWRDEDGDLYFGFEDAFRAASNEAEGIRERAYNRISGPVERGLSEQGTLYRNFSFADDEDYPYREILLTLDNFSPGSPSRNFVESHWKDQRNVLAHIRLTDFGKTLFVEELQSDWGQAIRRGNKNAPTDAPFVGNTGKWLTFALKKVLHEAALGDYKQIAFITGEQSLKRYSLAEYVSKIELVLNQERGCYVLNAYDKDGDWIHIPRHANDNLSAIGRDGAPEVLERYIGKELTDRLLQQEKSYFHGSESYTQTLEGIQLHIPNGTGMRKFYDEVVPNTLRPLLKKLDPAIEIGTVSLRETCEDQPVMEITDTLRDRVLAGQALFSFAPAPDLSAQEAVTTRGAADSLPQYRQTHTLLGERLGTHAAGLITLTDRLPDGTPLLQEGAHTRADGQTYINPARIAPLHDAGGKEILSRDERVLWVAHHELFHRGVSVRGGQALAHSLQQADSNTFVHTLTDAILRERQTLAPETAPRNRLEAVEEALAELHAARESGRMDALHARYLPYAPGLVLPQQHDGWRGKLCGYADSVRGVLRRLTRREVSMTDAQITLLTGRIGAAATRELSPQQTPAADGGAPQQPRPDFSVCASPRDAGRLAWAFIGGDPARLPEAIKILEEQGYRVDERRLRDTAQHPLMQREALMKAVSKTLPPPQKTVQAER